MDPASQLAVGIDLGTTYSVVACLDESGQPRALANAEGDRLTPSAVFFEGDEVIVGKEALRALSTDAASVAICPKRELGRRFYSRPLGGRQYPPETLQAWILNKLRLDASRQIGRVSQAVITVPAYFDELRRKATQDAGYMAGLEVLDIINEPTAAAIAFGYQHLAGMGEAASRRLLVYDLGGGTFDVTVLEVQGSQLTALATDGDVQLGGYDWDERLLHHVAQAFLRDQGFDPRDDPTTCARWWRECEEAKRTLSVRDKALIACDGHSRSWRQEIRRAEFEDLTADLLERTRFTVEETVAASGLTWGQIDDVLLVGGATRMPAVHAMLRQISGKEPNSAISPDEAVAHGAALRAGFLLAESRKNRPTFRIRDINSHSLGVAGTDSLTQHPRTAVLIPRNSPLPAAARRVFKTQKNDQRSVLIPIVEGESTHPADCVQLGECVVRELPDDLPAQTPIEVRFRYEENGRLTLDVHILGMDRGLQHSLVRENSISPEQLDAWRQHIAKLPPAPTDGLQDHGRGK